MPAANGKTLVALENVAFGYDNIHTIDNCLKGRQQHHEEEENDDDNNNDNNNNDDLPLVFENVDTSLEAHDRVLLQGYNGCGKTTLVQLILGQLQPTEGTIHCYTENSLYFSQTALQQLMRQHGNLTALEFLLLNFIKNATATATTTTSESQARQHLGDWGLTKDLAMSRVATLSAGQRVRLWLAKQLLIHPKPSLLILDEVSENVDVETRESLVELLKTFAGAVLVISHDPDFVERGSFTKIWKLWRYGLEVTFPDN